MKGKGVILIMTMVCAFITANAQTIVYKSIDASGSVAFSDKAPAQSAHATQVVLNTPPEAVQMQQANSKVTAKELQIGPSSTTALSHEQKANQEKLFELKSLVKHAETVLTKSVNSYNAARSQYQVAREHYVSNTSVNAQDELLRSKRLHLMTEVIRLAKHRVDEAKEQLRLARRELNANIHRQ